jgi:hypothetical protein
MKRCPSCNRTYTEEVLSYCLDDGTPLQPVVPGSGSSYDPQATVSFQSLNDPGPQTQKVSPAPTIVSSQQPVFQPSPQPQQQWSPTPQPPPQNKKRSALPWVIGALVLVVVLIGGFAGIIGLLIYIGSKAENSNARSSNKNSGIARANANTNKNANVASPTPSPADSTVARDAYDDFSTQKWGTGSDSLGKFWYTDGEFHANAVPGNYLVEYGPKETPYYTKDATVRMTTRAVDGISPKYGFGFVVHGELKDKQLEDYGFIIKTDARPSYAVVKHKGGKETFLTQWTSSDNIYTGSTPNRLEVRIKDNLLDFYINGKYVNSVVDDENFKTGRVGVYTSDTAEVAFDDLEVVH